MERCSGALEEAADGARQQERHYQLLSALQAAPVLHHTQRPGPGAARRHRVRDRPGAAGDPAPHREEPVQPAPAVPMHGAPKHPLGPENSSPGATRWAKPPEPWPLPGIPTGVGGASGAPSSGECSSGSL
ncbi:hypothetical protein K5549_021810, partial [Capra hircus]